MELTKEVIEFSKLMATELQLPKTSVEEAYLFGYDCGENGASLLNCHFSVFRSREHADSWNEGKKDAEEGKQNKFLNSK